MQHERIFFPKYKPPHNKEAVTEMQNAVEEIEEVNMELETKESETSSDKSNCFIEMEPKNDCAQERRKEDIRQETVKDMGEKEK